MTNSNIAAGELVLRANPMGIVLKDTHTHRWCAHCLSYTTDGVLPLHCEACDSSWCTKRCREASHISAQCRILENINAAGLKHDVAFEARWLVSIIRACKGDNSGKTKLFSLLSDCKTIAGFPKRSKLRARAVKAYTAACKAAGEHAAATEGELEAMLAAAPLNDFGFFDKDGEECGQGNFPQVAMANHSCVPSVALRQEGAAMCFYALEDLSKGEEVLHCYISLDEEDAQERIHETWGFTCECPRCQGEDTREFDEKHRCECGGVVVATREGGCTCNTSNLWNLQQ